MLNKKITSKLKGRKTVAAIVLTISFLLLIILPSVWLLYASFEEVKVIKIVKQYC